MTSERVDKKWQSKGLAGYSTGAIVGTLQHYGVSVEEGAFRTQAEAAWPLEIAEGWMEAWKGTGQFSQFPFAAAEELWRRAWPERLSPGEFSASLAALIEALDALLAGQADAPVGVAHKAVQALEPRLPKKDGRLVERFAIEVLMRLGHGVERMNHLAEELAKEGHLDDAMDFARIEELVFPHREGTSQAVVRALGGHRAEGVATLLGLASKGEAVGELRLAAIDGLIMLEELEAARAPADALLAIAESQKDWHLALDVAERLRYLLSKLGQVSGAEALVRRMEAVEAAHAREHPGHAHGHSH